MKQPLPTTPIVDGNELVLEYLNTKLQSGHELSNIEANLGIISSKIVKGNQYGPDITEIDINGVVLPEQVKSMIIDAIG